MAKLNLDCYYDYDLSESKIKRTKELMALNAYYGGGPKFRPTFSIPQSFIPEL